MIILRILTSSPGHQPDEFVQSSSSKEVQEKDQFFEDWGRYLDLLHTATEDRDFDKNQSGASFSSHEVI